MLYRIFETEELAKEYSQAIAYDNGCNEHTSTQYWYSWRETADGRWAVQCPDGTETEPVWKEENNEAN